MRWLFGVRYSDGKLCFFRTNKNGKFGTNPGVTVPDWAIDIRELVAMFFVGIAALFLISKNYINEAMYLLVALVSYAIGRTVPQIPVKKQKPSES